MALLWSGHARCPRGVCFVIITVQVAVTVLVKFGELPCVSAVWGLKIVCVCERERHREREISLTISVQLYYNSMTAVRRCILYFPFKSLWMPHPLKNNPTHSLRWG